MVIKKGRLISAALFLLSNCCQPHMARVCGIAEQGMGLEAVCKYREWATTPLR